MRPIKPVFALMLSVILLITAQGMAFARSQAPADGQMVLCTGHGSLVVYVDGDGQPTTAPQLCSDAAQAFFSVAIDAPLATFVPVAHSFSPVALGCVLCTGQVPRGGSARGPPVS